MVVIILKFSTQTEKIGKDLSKYSKIEDKIAATLIFAATLIIAPTVHVVTHYMLLQHDSQLKWLFQEMANNKHL
jgi:hypothetical protein